MKLSRNPAADSWRARAAATVLAAVTAVSPGLAIAQQAAAPQPAAATTQQAEQPQAPMLDLSLFDAVETALRYNLQVRIATLSPELQAESITSARARFDPSFTFNLPTAYSRNATQGTSSLAGATVLTSENVVGGFSFNQVLDYGTDWTLNWTAGRNVTNNTFSTFNPNYNSRLLLQVRQPLLRNFGKEVNRQQIIVAQNNYQISEEQFRQQVQNILLQVYLSYWEMIFSQRDLEVRQLSLDLALEQLERNRIQVEIGTLAPIETVQAEQQVASRQLALIQAQVALRDREDDLKRFLNIDAANQYGWDVKLNPTAEPRVDDTDIDVDAAINEAIDNDPTLRQRRVEMGTRQLNVRVARNQLLPQINFVGSIQLSGDGGDRIIRTSGLTGTGVLEIQEGGFSDAMQNLFSGDFRNWSLGLSVQFPINNWAAKAQHAQAIINERNTSLQMADREQALRVEVLKAARQVESGIEQVAQSRTARELAERQLDAEERKFSVGTTTNFQVLEFQRQLADARSAELRSLITYIANRARLEFAKGTLLEALGVNIGMAGVPGSR